MIGTPSAICWLAKHVCGCGRVPTNAGQASNRTGSEDWRPTPRDDRQTGCFDGEKEHPVIPCYHNLIVFDGNGPIDGSLDGLLLAVRPADVDRDGVGMGADAKVQSHVVLIALPRCSLDLP